MSEPPIEPPIEPPAGPPIEPPLAPTERLSPLGPTARRSVVDPVGPATLAERQAFWWQREMAIVAVGIFALLVGGVVGYLLGNANTKTKIVHGATTTNTVARAPTTTTVATSTTITGPTKTTTVAKSTTVATPPKTVTTPKRTVTAPSRTVTVPGAAKTVTVPVTHTVTQTKTVTASTSTSTSTSGGTQNFSGANTQNIGTVRAATQSQLRWSCPGCGAASFTISNSAQDPSPIGVNSQNATSGQAVVAAGTYTSVMVQGTGPWSFTLTSQG